MPGKSVDELVRIKQHPNEGMYSAGMDDSILRYLKKNGYVVRIRRDAGHAVQAVWPGRGRTENDWWFDIHDVAERNVFDGRVDE